MIKDILVHLDGTDDDEWRIAYTGLIARMFQAHVTGLFLHRLTTGSIPVEAGYFDREALEHVITQVSVEGDRIERKLMNKLSRLNLPFEMRRIDASFDQIVQAAITEARATDICVLLRPYASDGTPRWLGIAEGILFGSGRSILIAPDDLSGCHGIEHVLIAWNASREAAHAVAEAMPFLKQAREITAIMVEPDPGDVGDLRGARLARHLEHHGIKLGIRVVHTHGLKVSEILIREVARSDADLMVMGGYGHTRLREWVLGGATRDLLHRTSIPLLLAH